MKRYCFIILLILNNLLFSQNHPVCVVYSTSYNGKVFTNDGGKEKEALSNATKGSEDKIKTLSFLLLTDDAKSYFKAQQEMTKDNESLADKMGKIIAGYDDEFYRDNDKKMLLSDKVIGGKRFKIHEIYNDFVWELTTDEKIIQGYKCYLAKTKLLHLNVYAWYCPSLPYHTGPREFGGLPGLILELQRGDLLFQATKISFTSEDKVDFDITKFKTIELSEVTKMLTKIREDQMENGN